MWTPLGKEEKDSEGRRCICWRQDSVKDINGIIVLRTEPKRQYTGTYFHYRCNVQMIL